MIITYFHHITSSNFCHWSEGCKIILLLLSYFVFFVSMNGNDHIPDSIIRVVSFILVLINISCGV